MPDDAGYRGHYAALNQDHHATHDRRWWQRFPRPVERAALTAWGLLPGAIRRPLIPLGALFGPHATSGDGSGYPGPRTVPGVAEIAAEGFTPLEEHTGALDIGTVWPEPHRRSVADTRPEPLDGSGVIWLVRSPWPGISLPQALNVVWSEVDPLRLRDQAGRVAAMGRALRLDEAAARARLAELPAED